jgi:hypothetical protein
MVTWLGRRAVVVLGKAFASRGEIFDYKLMLMGFAKNAPPWII